MEANLMQRLFALAMFNGTGKDCESFISKSSFQNTAQELMLRGEFIFGPEEVDTRSSSQFLIILLDSIEKWSQIEYDPTSNN